MNSFDLASYRQRWSFNSNCNIVYDCMIKFLFHFKLLYLNLNVVKKVFFYKQCLFLIMSDMHMMVANPEKVMCYLKTF